MASEVGELPIAANYLTSDKHTPPSHSHILESTREKSSSYDVLERLQSGINHEISQIKSQFLSEIDENDDEELARLETEIETVCDIVFGPLRLPRETLTSENYLDIAEKETSARIQHAITHAAYYAALPEADPHFTQSVYESIKLGKKLAFLPQKQGVDTQLPTYWMGIQNQIAVVKALKRGGCEVFLPDYAQDTYALESEDDNEVLQLDVRSGIDLIAVKNGTTFLIDAKGRRRILEHDLAENAFVPEKISLDSIRNKGVRKTIDVLRDQTRINPKAVFQTKIYIPSSQANFRSLELPDNPTDMKTHLAQFGRLEDHVEKALLWRLANPQHGIQFLRAHNRSRAYSTAV